MLVEGDTPAQAGLEAVASYADSKDQPTLAAAVLQQCRTLVTLNESDFWPPPELMTVVRPGDLLRLLRTQLAAL